MLKKCMSGSSSMFAALLDFIIIQIIFLILQFGIGYSVANMIFEGSHHTFPMKWAIGALGLSAWILLILFAAKIGFKKICCYYDAKHEQDGYGYHTKYEHPNHNNVTHKGSHDDMHNVKHTTTHEKHKKHDNS